MAKHDPDRGFLQGTPGTHSNDVVLGDRGIAKKNGYHVGMRIAQRSRDEVAVVPTGEGFAFPEGQWAAPPFGGLADRGVLRIGSLKKLKDLRLSPIGRGLPDLRTNIRKVGQRYGEGEKELGVGAASKRGSPRGEGQKFYNLFGGEPPKFVLNVSNPQFRVP